MAVYKHYSFDLWLTLIRSNPTFKQERAAHFHKYYNFTQKPLDVVVAIFRQVDLMVNHVNENTGKNIDADEMYLMVISLINGGHESIAGIDARALCRDMDSMLLNYMPRVYDDDTLPTLDKLCTAGHTTNILSNTGFICGQTLRNVLQELGLAAYFNFMLFSDESGYSKPNPLFFKQMVDSASRLHSEQLSPADILHIGDNAHADGRGAANCGIAHFIINSTPLTIKNLTQHETANILAT